MGTGEESGRLAQSPILVAERDARRLRAGRPLSSSLGNPAAVEGGRKKDRVKKDSLLRAQSPLVGRILLPHQPLIEPTHDVLQPFDAVLRFTGA